MGLANDMKKLKEDILASYQERANEYQQRLQENQELVSEVQKTLDQFRTSHLEMAANLHANAEALKDNLSREEADRLNAFGKLMAGIKNSISSIQAEVEDIRNSTVHLLDTFAGARGEMAAGLKEKFMQAGADRKQKDQERLNIFDSLMKTIQNDLDQSKDEVRKIMSDTDHLLRKYADDQATMAATTRNNLNANLEERIAYTRKLLNTFSDRLIGIHNENLMMAQTLRNELVQSRKNLSASDTKRMEEFNTTMSLIRQRVGDIQALISNMLNNLTTDRMQAASEWESLPESIALIRKNMTWSTDPGSTDSSDPVPTSVVSEEQAEETEDSGEMKEEKEEDSEGAVGKNLEEKIIRYVNAHPEGVKVSEMEEPLGEQRMRIGYVCKKLVEEGKIIKLDRAYFPKTKS
jgi:ElaB/YqjD/DUF883 family membrane-anchored ribosome-binding protein